MHRFFHILGRPGEPAVWFMSESGAVGSWQARTYVGLPITSSGFETAAVVRGLRFRAVDRRVAGSIPDSTNFLTNSFGQATNALVSLFTKQ